ncbi:MAG: GGDEF domain-containing protein [Rhodocyclaceae bacterium]|nr:GGDEF domain-containing protein [Rhodocyclaceae bacterium]
MSRLAFPGKLKPQVLVDTDYMSDAYQPFDPAYSTNHSPEALILHHAAVISAQRDRAELEVVVMDAIRAALDAASVELFRVFTPKGDCLAGLVAKADDNGRHCLDDGLSWPANTASIEHFPALHRSLTSGHSIVVPATEDGLHEQVFPVVREGNVFFAFVVVRQRAALSTQQQQLVHGLIRLFCNQLRMLDYSEVDTLTGLLNRKTFDESLLRILSSLQHNDIVADGNILHLPRRRHALDTEESHWLGVIDIDHFKNINDTYGHLIGDEVLLMIANMMKSSFRTHDKLFRFGGEEFVVVLKPTEQHNALMIFERFRRQIEDHPFPQVGHLTISTGFARIGINDLPSAIIDNADEALYWAKHHGRNQVFNYEALVAAGHLKKRDAETSNVELF